MGRIDGLTEAGRIELVARDVREDHAVAPGERQLALVRAGRVDYLRVTFERVDHLDRAMPRLRQRVEHDLELAVGNDLPGLPGSRS